MAERKKQPSASTPLYFVNPWVDFACIGGLSIAVFLALRLFHSGDKTVAIYTISGFMLWVINWPHFSATSFRLYHTRENISQYPFTALLTPILVALGAWASFKYPEAVAPFFVKLFIIWSPFHFSGQSVGITMVYARRAGVPIDPWARRGLALFIFGSFVTPTLRFEAGSVDGTFYGISYPAFGLPPWMAELSHLLMWAGGILFVALLLSSGAKEKKKIPLILFLPAVTQYIWFVGAGSWKSFIEFVPAFHGLQYLLIAWAMQLTEKMKAEKATPSKAFVVKESLRWGILNIAGGAFLFFVLPRLFAVAGPALAFSIGVLHSAVQIHHFFVDGVIWKLKNKSVASPLMVSLSKLVTPTSPRRVS